MHTVLGYECDRNEMFLITKSWSHGCIYVLANMTKELGVMDHRYHTAYGIAPDHELSCTIDRSSNHGRTAKTSRRRCLPIKTAMLGYLDQSFLCEI